MPTYTFGSQLDAEALRGYTPHGYPAENYPPAGGKTAIL